MPFQKGNKLAKGGKRDGAGRKKSDIAAARQELAERHGPAAFARIVQIAERIDHPDCLKANQLIVAYWLGKPKETTDLNVSGGLTIKVKWADGSGPR